MSAVANCPSCGAPVEFAIGSSSVVVCGTCRSVVARTDRGVEDHGRVAALIDTGSPLRAGTTGSYRGLGYRITGRTQLRHQAGGVWDEWYAAFDDGRWGWLAEGQGRFYLTFRAGAGAAPYESLRLGEPALEGDSLVVAEFGEATLLSAEGELPWRPLPNETYRYADLTGPGNRFATIDYSEEPPLVFKGVELTFRDLGVTDADVGRASARPALTTLNCTQCGGALELKAPDTAERIWCPYCGAGHDVTQGKLQFFRKLRKMRVEPVIPLGSTGTIDGDAYVVAGFMERAVRFDRDYFWTEYLLYDRERGYRWLVHSDDHWSFVTPLRPGEVQDPQPNGSPMHVSYGGRSFRLFQTATARVTHVAGEFYWRVEVGEKVDTSDYVSPPFGISKEITRSGASEISYSHARYMTPKEVSSAFGIRRLPDPAGVGPMQPFPGGSLLKPWLLMLMLLFAVTIFLQVTLPDRVVHRRTYDLTTAAVPQGAPENVRVLFSEPFPLSGRHNVKVTAGAVGLSNSWIHLALDLVSEDSDRMTSFEAPLEYYSGVDQGERWSEGSSTDNTWLSRPRAGNYVLRVEAQWEQGRTPPPIDIVVREGVFRFLYFLLALAAISILPALSAFRRISWESRRWQDSSFSPFGTSGDDEEEDE